MGEEDVRKEAVDRFMRGERATGICAQLGRSCRWLRKWVGRYKSGDEGWFKDKSRQPLRSPNKTPEDIEQHIVDVRNKLENTKYAQVGALAIQYELQRSGIQTPGLRTIERILHRHGLVRKQQRKYVPKGKDYPEIAADGPHKIHQMDIVGPRFITNDGRFYSINVMDVFAGKAAVNIRRRRTHKDVVGALLDTWHRMAIPVYLQMDNQLPFRGSNRYPRSFGLVVRACLHLHIQPVFIPLAEPWRNGCVEKFQDVFDKVFFRSEGFDAFQEVVEEAPTFEAFHNQNHRYSTRQGKTPNSIETGSACVPRRLAESFKLPEELYIEPGQVHLIRFIRSTATLDVFGLKFTMPPEVIYEYVTATIHTGEQTLSVIHDGKVVWTQKFTVAETPMKIKW